MNTKACGLAWQINFCLGRHQAHYIIIFSAYFRIWVTFRDVLMHAALISSFPENKHHVIQLLRIFKISTDLKFLKLVEILKIVKIWNLVQDFYLSDPSLSMHVNFFVDGQLLLRCEEFSEIILLLLADENLFLEPKILLKWCCNAKPTNYQCFLPMVHSQRMHSLEIQLVISYIFQASRSISTPIDRHYGCREN